MVEQPSGFRIVSDKASIIPLNFELILNPLNWVTIILMLLIAGFALHLLLPNLATSTPAPVNQGS